jgi:putative CocE/NonD family hydrolase
MVFGALGGLLLLSMTPFAAMAADEFGHYAPAPKYHERVSETFYLPMRDGVRIAMRVTRPSIAGKSVSERLPVIWTGTLTVSEPAPRAHDLSQASDYRDIPTLTDYGYVIVSVARRGNGQSFGARRGYNDRIEAYDAYEITEWLAAQPWSTGAVGVYGCSNTGDAAMHAVTVEPPHLKAAFAGCFSWNKWDAFHRGGIYAQWGVGPTRTLKEDLDIDPVDGDTDRSSLRRAAEEHQSSTVLADLWHSMPFRDSWAPSVASRFWYEGSISSYAEQIRHSGVPLYIQGGWHDELRDQGLITLLNVPNSRILIGPWMHCMSPDFTLLQEIHRFFDTYLKGVHTKLASEPRIHYFRINDPNGASGAWHASAQWPLSSMHRQRWFLSGTGTLVTEPVSAESRGFQVNAPAPCPRDNQGPFAQPCHVEGAGLAFASDPLPRNTEVTGNPVIRVRVSAGRGDANLFVYLEDVAPDGNVVEVTEGRQRAEFRALAPAPWTLPGTPWHRGWQEDAQPLSDALPADIDFDLMPSSYVFQRGHRIQLTVTGSDYRESARDRHSEGMQIKLLFDATHPAYVDLPIIP